MKAGHIWIGLGTLLIVVGLAVNRGWFSWFGRLPGDIRREGARGGFFFPLTSSILISIVLTVIVNLLVRLFRDRG
jgi:membrane protein implicated in regulation of membrane protease activity